MKESLSILEYAHMTTILLYVAESGGCMKSDIYRITSHSTTMPGKIQDLEDAGLLVQERCGRRTMIRVTDKGARVAELLIRIRGIIEDG